MSDYRENVQKEAIKIALENDRCGLDISVRLGKTFIGLSIASKFNKVLVSYPNLSILDSWTSDAEKFDFNTDNIIFTTHLSLNKHNLDEFDCILLDEVDSVSENQWAYISGWNHKVIKGLSGTFPNSGAKKKFIEEYCPIKYTVKLDDTTNKTSKDYEIIVYLLEPSQISNIPLKSGKTWSEQQKIQFWENKYNSSHNFIDMLKLIQAIQNSKTKLNFLKKLSTKIDRCLIFLETTKQCEELNEFSYHSKDKNSESNLKLFQDGTIHKLSCVKQLSSGITFKSLNECIILHSYASNSKFHQRMARCLQYCEGEKAIIHLICLKNTRDLQWCQKGLVEFDSAKIKYLNI